RQRYTALVVATPVSALSFNASAGRVKDDYPESQYGLNNAENNVYSVGFDAVPIDSRVTFGAAYGYERNRSRQASHYAAHVTSGLPPTWSDPRADWWNDTNDKTHHASATADIVKVLPAVDLRVGYDYTRGQTGFYYTTAPNFVQAAPVQLPAATNERNT